MLNLRIRDPQFFRKRSTGTAIRTIDLETEPSPTIMATGLRSVSCDKYWIEDDAKMRVWMEHQAGLPSGKHRRFPGYAHYFVDVTDRPSETIVQGRPVTIILERIEMRPPPKTDKPPYRVPSIAEVKRVKPSGFTVISTFAGCGGSSLGYRMAGFRVLWASEFVDAARAVYEANKAPWTIVDGRDVREVDPLAIMKQLGLKPGDLDVLDGSPPCASFSTAGKRDKHWGEEKKYSDKVQRTDDLFFEYVRFVKAFQPKVFVAENVSGLVKGVAKGYFLEILAALKGCGYRVEAQLLDAQWLGVPQARQRIIFVGVRNDLALAPAFPTPFAYRYSVRDAIPWIAGASFSTGGQNQAKDPKLAADAPAHSITAGAKNATHHLVEAAIVGNSNASHSRKGERRSVDEPSRTIMARRVNLEVVEGEADIARQAIGEEWDRLNPGQQSDKYFSLVRTDQNEPCPTVTAAGGMNSGIATVTHPTEKRKFSIAELKRICAFPDDFELSGSYAQQWERLGRAVPPLMMRAIATAVREKVLRPASARSAGRAPRSPGRSTTGKPRTGGATKRSGTGRTGKPAPSTGKPRRGSPLEAR